MTTAVCHTADCPNDGIAIDVNLAYTDDEGNEQQAGSVYCGPCGNEITDLDPAPQARPA